MEPAKRNAVAETGFLSHSLILGSIAGTKIRLHWTFLVYLFWLGASFLVSGGAGEALSGVTLVVAVFGCVLAHEFGHILMARRFGVATPDVTLLPIGGVARLQAIPERPGQELAVAVAGPAVNLAIATVLMAIFGPERITPDLATITRPADILPALAAINLFLALFNLLPAFPMDGGRALRAVLAILLDRTRATRIAAHIGQGFAIGLSLLGLVSGNVVLIFIALFVFFAASAEAQEVQLRRLAERLRVSDAMVTELQTLSTSDTLENAVQLLLRTSQLEFPVTDEQGSLSGVLTREGMVRGLHAHGPGLPVVRAMVEDLPTVSAESVLVDALPLMEGATLPVVVLDGAGRVAGLLTRENLGDLLLLANTSWRGQGHTSPILRT